jgi:hypothetical protein
VGEVLGALNEEMRQPIDVDLDLGGTLDAPEVERAGG